MGALYGLAWMTSIGWFYIADSIVGGILLVNLTLPWISLRGMSAGRRPSSSHRSRGIFEDDAIAITIELSSRSVLPKSFIVVQEECPVAPPDAGPFDFLIGTIGPWGRVQASYDVRCYKRGVYSFAPVRLQTSAPFGLFRARRTVPAPLEVTIYPKCCQSRLATPTARSKGSMRRRARRGRAVSSGALGSSSTTTTSVTSIGGTRPNAES